MAKMAITLRVNGILKFNLIKTHIFQSVLPYSVHLLPLVVDFISDDIRSSLHSNILYKLFHFSFT